MDGDARLAALRVSDAVPTPTAILDKALTYVFAKDRDFQEFLRTPEASRVPSVLRVRRAGSNDATEQPVSKPNGGVEPAGIVRASRA